jgi:hypothetical protein
VKAAPVAGQKAPKTSPVPRRPASIAWRARPAGEACVRTGSRPGWLVALRGPLSSRQITPRPAGGALWRVSLRRVFPRTPGRPARRTRVPACARASPPGAGSHRSGCAGWRSPCARADTRRAGRASPRQTAGPGGAGWAARQRSPRQAHRPSGSPGAPSGGRPQGPRGPRRCSDECGGAPSPRPAQAPRRWRAEQAKVPAAQRLECLRRGVSPQRARQAIRARSTRRTGAVRERARVSTVAASSAVRSRRQTGLPRIACLPLRRDRHHAAPHAG